MTVIASFEKSGITQKIHEDEKNNLFDFILQYS